MSLCLERWGKAVTMKLFASSSSFTSCQRESVLNLVEWIRQSDRGNIYECPLQDDNLRLVCCLPYVLGFASHEDRISRSILDLRKPILVLAASQESFLILEKSLSSQAVDDGNSPYLCCLGYLSAAQMDQGAYYKTFVIRESGDARRITRVLGKVDIVLSNMENVTTLQGGCFSVVFLYEAQDLSMDEYQIVENKFALNSVMVLFKSQSLPLDDNLSPESIDDGAEKSKCTLKGDTQTTPLLVSHAHIVNANFISNYLSKAQLNVLNEIVIHLCDMHNVNIPVEVSVCKKDGGIGLLCYLPYFLGQSSTFLPHVDLQKPILVLAASPQCWDILRKNLQESPYLVNNGHLSNSDVSGGALYRTYLVEDVYGAATASRLVGQYEIIVASSGYYQSLPKDCFSVVIVYGSNYQTPAMESSTMKAFRDCKTIFFKMEAKEPEEDNTVTRMNPRMSALYQALGETSLVPRVVRYGKHVKDAYLFNEGSLLTQSQQMGLNMLVDWFVFSEGANQSVVMTSVIGLDQTAQMICCLPYMYGWAVSAGHISETSLDLRFPILILGRKKLIHRLGRMVRSMPFFIPSDSLAAFENYSDAICTSYFVKDAESAKNSRQIIGYYDVALSDIKLLQDLPSNCFSMVLVFSASSVLESTMDEVVTKFSPHSKLAFINAQFSIDEIPEQLPGDHSPSDDVLVTFGERVRDRLFGGLCSFSVQELAAVGASVDWFTLPETSDLPLVVEIGPDSSVDLGKVLSVLPYMLGWSVQSDSVPASEAKRKINTVLFLASGGDTLEFLSPFFFYPYLVKSSILTPELAHLGAYYSARVLTDHDIAAVTTLENSHNVFICELKHYERFPSDFASATYVVSQEDLDPEIQKGVRGKFASHTKLAFFKTSTIPDTFLLYSLEDSADQSPLILRYGVDSLPNKSKIPKLMGVSRMSDSAASLQNKLEKNGMLDTRVEDRNVIQDLEGSVDNNNVGQYLEECKVSSSKLVQSQKDAPGDVDQREAGFMSDSFHLPIPHRTSSTQTDQSKIPSSEVACQTVEAVTHKKMQKVEEQHLPACKVLQHDDKKESVEVSMKDIPSNKNESEILRLRMAAEDPGLATGSTSRLDWKESFLTSDGISPVSHSSEALQIEALATSSYSLTLDKEMTLSELLDEMLCMPKDMVKKKRRKLKHKRSLSHRLLPNWIREKLIIWKNCSKRKSKEERVVTKKPSKLFNSKFRKWPWSERSKTGTTGCQTEGELEDYLSDEELEFDVQIPGSKRKTSKINVVVSVHDVVDRSEEAEFKESSASMQCTQHQTSDVSVTPGKQSGEEKGRREVAKRVSISSTLPSVHTC